MRATEVVSSAPIQTEKSLRGEEIRVLTSGRAGTVLPLKAIPVLREDRVSRGNITLNFEMKETVRPLMNAVNVTVYAHFVPFSAFERFFGMDSFNRSYQMQPEPHDGSVIPFFQPVAFNHELPFWRTLGAHAVDGQSVNSAYLEAYNLLVNFRRHARSEYLEKRDLMNTTLAEAFWKNPTTWHLVPNFDQAMLDGEVPLAIGLSGTLPVSGSAAVKHLKNGRIQHVVDVTGSPVAGDGESAFTYVGAGGFYRGQWLQSGNETTPLGIDPNGSLGVDPSGLFVELAAEMAESSASLSLANIELAKKTVAFAKLREQYKGISDDHLIDLLMEGVRVPEEALRQPILLDRQSTIFGYSERHAMDGASLDQSVTTGFTEVDISFRTPPLNTGGIILITAEIVPEQLFERMRDKFLFMESPDEFPNFLRDYLDPEKVDVVPNEYIDVHHSQPDATFGYAPLNHEWKRSLTSVGGRFYRPLADGFVEDRQRFWNVEVKDPELQRDFYLCPPDFPHTVFADRDADPFEVIGQGHIEFVGNTVFGKALEEYAGNYDAVRDQVDDGRIVQDAVPVADNTFASDDHGMTVIKP